MLLSMENKYSSHHEIKKIKKIKYKSSKKISYSRSDISISDSDSYSSLSSESEWEKPRQTTELKEINKLYHIVTNNTKKNKNQHNDAIEYEPNFDNTFSLSRGTKYPLPVVTVSLRGGNKQTVRIITSLTCLWDIRATDRMIKRRHTKPYERKIHSNKV